MLTKKNKKKYLFVWLTVIVTLGLLTINAFWLEPNRFVVTHHLLNQHLIENGDSLKIVQLSDLHLKQFNHRARQIAEQANQLQPDIVVFTGDSIDNAKQLWGFEQFLSHLNRHASKYAIVGNWEYWAEIDLKLLARIYATYNCHLLVNESVLHRQGNRSLLITGVDDLVNQPDLIKSLQGVAPDPNHLLLAHSPVYGDAFSNGELEILAEYKPQLMLSGHTHGGQLRLFGFAPLRPRGSGRYLSGWYRDGVIPLYVSRGLGFSVLPVRIGAVPEISYFEWFFKKESVVHQTMVG